jgi:prevent-host-death family protein
MIRTNISDLKNRLSHYLRLVKAGEVVEIVDRNKPLARIEAIEGGQGAASGEKWLMNRIESGIITVPKSKASPSIFADLSHMAMENGEYAGVLEALKEERREGR